MVGTFALPERDGHYINDKANALSLLRTILAAAQKCRSISAESWGEVAQDEAFMATINPWLYGTGNIVPKLAEAIGRYEKPRAAIPGSELYNFLYIATRGEPSIGMCMVNFSDRWASIESDVRWYGQTFTDEPLYADEGVTDPHA